MCGHSLRLDNQPMIAPDPYITIRTNRDLE
jgi:hypothetical protein